MFNISRLVTVCTAVFTLLHVPAQADDRVYGVLTVADTAQGLSDASPAIDATTDVLSFCFGQVEDAAVRFTIDGTTATATTGTPAATGSYITLRGQSALEDFSVIRSGGSNATIKLTCSRAGEAYVEAGGATVSAATEYTEDNAAPGDPTGTAPLLVRADTPATIATTDGDFVAQRGTDYGAAYVQIVDSSGNFINSFGGSGGTSHADDATFTIASASSTTPTAFLADDTTPDSVEEGDVGVPRMTLTRKPYAVITDATSENNASVDGSGHLQVDIAADSAGIGGGTQYATDDALGATPTLTLGGAARDDALSALTPEEGDAVHLRVDANGAVWTHDDALDAALSGNELQVDIVAALPTGSNTIGTVTAAQATASSLNAQVVGNVASAATDSGNPVKIGGIFNTTQPTVTNGQRVNLQTNNRGGLIVANGVNAFTVTASNTTGNVASAATDSGNPVKIGGIFNTTQPTFTNGQRGNVQISSRGALRVVPGVENFAMQLEGGAVVATDGSAGPANAISVGGTESGGNFQEFLVDSLGHLQVDVLTVPTTTVTATDLDVQIGGSDVVQVGDNSSTLSVDDGGTELTVEGPVLDSIADGITAEGAATDDTTTHTMGSTTGHIIMAAAQPTDTSVDANDIAAIGMSTDRRVYTDTQLVGQDVALDVSAATVTVTATDLDVQIGGSDVVQVGDNSTTLSVDDGGLELTVDGTVAVSSITTSITPGTAAGNLGKAADAPHSSTDVGVQLLGVRTASPTNRSSLDGDYEPLQLSAGRLWASSIVTEIEDGAGDSVMDAANDAIQVNVVAGSAAGTEYTEDAVAAGDPIGAAVILVRDDTPNTQTTTDGDNIAQRGTNYGAAYVQVVDSAGNFVDSFGGSGGTSLADDGDVTAGTTLGTPAIGFYQSTPTNCTDGDGCIVGVTQGRELKTSDDNLETVFGTDTIFGTAGTADADVLTIQGIASMTAVQVSATDLDVQSNGQDLATSTEASAIQAAVEILDDWDATHDSAIGADGTTLMGEFKDQDGVALPNTVGTEGDAVRLAASAAGILYVMPVDEDGTTAVLNQIQSAVELLDDAIDSGGSEMQVDIVTQPNPPAYDATADANKVNLVNAAGTEIDFSSSTAYSDTSTTAMWATNIKSSAGTVDGWSCSSVASGTAYARLVNKATTPDPSVDSDTLILARMLIKDTFGGFTESFPGGLNFGTGIGIVVTEVATAVDTDETALTVDEVTCNVRYR